MIYTHDKIERKDKRPRIGAWMPKCDDALLGEMESYLKGRGLDAPTAIENGWYPSRSANDTHPRIVIPATNTKGLAYWQARAMDNKVEPRYQSPGVSKGDSVIQVWPQQRDWLPVLVIVEGPMDALAAAGCGVRAVALMGITPTEETLDMVKTLSSDIDFVTFFCDRDAVSDAITVIPRCIQRGMSITISDPTPYQDLAAIPKRKREDILAMYIQSCMKGEKL
mgnify:CR=1 FL=1